MHKVKSFQKKLTVKQKANGSKQKSLNPKVQKSDLWAGWVEPMKTQYLVAPESSGSGGKSGVKNRKAG